MVNIPSLDYVEVIALFVERYLYQRKNYCHNSNG